MDINLLFRSGMRSCGRVLRVLPKDEIGSPMEYMMGVLKDETIPSLNIVYPRIFQAEFLLQDLIKINNVSDDNTLRHIKGLSEKYTYYRVPKELTEGLAIMSVRSCLPSTTFSRENTNHNSMFGTVNSLHSWGTSRNFGRYSSSNLYEAAAFAQLNYADRQLAGQFTEPFRYKFYPPNILAVISVYASDRLALTTEFNLENDENLISIPNTAYEGVRQLFILDLKKTIYNEYGIFSPIQTQNGDIDLKIDDWASAENDRNEKYNEYLTTAHFRTSTMRTG